MISAGKRCRRYSAGREVPRVTASCYRATGLNLTIPPTAAWVWRQLLEATAWRRQPAYLLRDRDAVYSREFAAKAHAIGIETLLAPYRAPRANAVAERVIRTLREECLDHVLVLGERHLEAVLTEYVRFYNTDRPHRSVGLTPPLPTACDPCAPVGPVIARPVLGGLHHVYSRAA